VHLVGFLLIALIGDAPVHEPEIRHKSYEAALRLLLKTVKR
jgi:hypothetical protein